MKYVAVYCGASTGNKLVYQAATQKLGHWLVDHQLNLVYGGGRVGLMGSLAAVVLADGGSVHGIMPEALFKRGAAATNLTELTIVESMTQRKQQMMAQAEACIALPGGPGTLEEISEAYSWTRIGANQNPCIFYNVDGFYDPLKVMFDQMVAAGFLTQTDRDKLLFSDSLPEIWSFIENYKPPRIRTY